MITKLVLKSLLNGELYTFIYPSKLQREVFIDHVKYIRFGSNHSWERKLRDHVIVSIDAGDSYAGMAEGEMKYIVHGHSETKQECMIAFSKNIDHDRAHEMLMDMYFGGDASEEIDINRPFSAGFIYATGTTHGRSESMNMESRKQDTDLAKSGMLKL